jgi:hypothetical protein
MANINLQNVTQCPIAKCYSEYIESRKRKRLLKARCEARLLYLGSDEGHRGGAGDLKKAKKVDRRHKTAKKGREARRKGSTGSVLNGLAEGRLEKAEPIMDIPQLRESIRNLIKRSAEAIAINVIQDATSGQLPAVKYLFEFAGLHPATEQTTERPIETTLAHTLLTRMGLPIEPLVEDEVRVPPKVAVSTGEVFERIP